MTTTQANTHTWSQVCSHLRRYGIDVDLLGVPEPAPADEDPVEETGDEDDDGNGGVDALFGDDEEEEDAPKLDPAEAEARTSADAWLDNLAER